MTSWVALLRAVNVGGTGRLPMSDLRSACEAAGFAAARTYLASGNAIFRSALCEAEIGTALRRALRDRTGAAPGAAPGADPGVLIRSAAEIADAARRNPFADEPGDRVVALFVDAPPADPLAGAAGLQGERVAPGLREIYVFYPEGMARTRLRLPAARAGTARNMNTVAALARMAAEG